MMPAARWVPPTDRRNIGAADAHEQGCHGRLMLVILAARFNRQLQIGVVDADDARWNVVLPKAQS